ncbi:UNVERIFIED_CONTAM: hypothetical protein PYX00_010358 [Menopon gallinae]|uniref:J domain-containing protein n=1 Tax=Menopon gallinae TaxID=328185 RepID=A0AAW2HF59_9NEOP
MYDDNQDSDIIEEDFYAFLNISREAQPEEITYAYRRLSKLYHPDKHLDPANKKEAEKLFNKTKRAYEILSDPHQRAIYDCLGVRGLQESWAVVQRHRTPQEIREEYERLAREREARRLEERTNAKGRVTMFINATDLFSPYETEYDEYMVSESLLPNIEVSGMSFAQSIEAPITPKDMVRLSGTLSAQNGRGSGSVNVGYRRITSEKAWVEWNGSVGKGPVLSMKTFRRLSKRLFGTFMTVLQFNPTETALGLNGSLGYDLGEHLVGDLTCRIGLENSMSTGIYRNTNVSTTALTFSYGLPYSYVSLLYVRRFFENDEALQVRLSLKAGNFGYMVEYGAEKQVSKQSTVGAAVRFGVPTGVTLKIKLSRRNQVYNFPILLSEEVMPSPIFYATVTPLFAWLLIKKLVIDPIKREQRLKTKEKQREANKNRLVELKREAKATKELMKETFSRIRTEEESKRGLVVVHALYGRIDRVSTGGTERKPAAAGEQVNDDDSEVIDVTVQLQVLVKDSKLILHDSSKSQIPGFYDPCVGEEKSLFIQYLFHNNLHQVVVPDTEPVRLPKNSHRVATT